MLVKVRTIGLSSKPWGLGPEDGSLYMHQSGPRNQVLGCVPSRNSFFLEWRELSEGLLWVRSLLAPEGRYRWLIYPQSINIYETRRVEPRTGRWSELLKQITALPTPLAFWKSLSHVERGAPLRQGEIHDWAEKQKGRCEGLERKISWREWRKGNMCGSEGNDLDWAELMINKRRNTGRGYNTPSWGSSQTLSAHQMTVLAWDSLVAAQTVWGMWREADNPVFRRRMWS